MKKLVILGVRTAGIPKLNGGRNHLGKRLHHVKPHSRDAVS
jgi:hypothetical protein